MIGTIVNDMYEYQKENGIPDKCLTNVQTLYDILKDLGIHNVKSKAYICVGNQQDGKKVNKKHMALIWDNYIIDPSYQVASLNDLRYYETYEDYMMTMEYPEFKEEEIQSFYRFIDVSKEINNGIFCRSPGLYYYNDQFDYIEARRYDYTQRM